jgi:hypothetical protein
MLRTLEQRGEWERKMRWGGRIEGTEIFQDANGGGAVEMEVTVMGSDAGARRDGDDRRGRDNEHA